MLGKIIQAVQLVLANQQAASGQPISKNIAYEAGRRIGVDQGLRMALEAINKVLSDDAKADNDL